tara:strand:+ start:11347 stop:12414 length:1068 start_codon:yes stop_codon:yes gene_type:complete
VKYRIKIFDDFNNTELKEAWLRLQLENDIFPQMFYEWINPWLKSKELKIEVYIITVTKDGLIEAIAPFCIEKKGFIKVLKTIPIHFGDFFMFISKQSSSINKEIIKHTKKCIRWDVVHFYNINSKNLLNKNLYLEGFKSNFLVNIHSADFKDLIYEDFLLTLSKNTRGQYRKKLNRIQRKGVVNFEIITTKESYMKNVDEMNNLYKKRWENEDRNLPSQEYYNMRTEAISSCFDKGKAALFKLSINGNAISYRLGFLHKKSFYDWKVVHHPDYNYYSPGNLLVGMIIDKIIDDGYEKFNFMTGDYRYKRSWVSEDQTTYNSEYFYSKNMSFGTFYLIYRIKCRDKLKEIYFKFKK